MNRMKTSLPKTVLIALALGLLLLPALLVETAEAQKQGAPLWYSVVSVNRVKKPDRKPAIALPATQRAALLTLQWNLLRRVEEGKSEEVNASKSFQNGDQVKLAVTANQNGYLYIVNQPEGKDGVLLFPDLRINNGQNRVLKDRQYKIPSYCPDLGEEDCWFELTPPAGTETMIVIFSREKIDTLPNQIDKPGSPVKRSIVEQLIASSEQKVKQMSGALAIPGKKVAKYATRVQNTNLKDNEELIAKIVIKHGE